MSSRFRLPLHPFLVALVPVVSMYAAQSGLGPRMELYLCAVIALLVTGVLLGAAWLVFRAADPAALLTSAFLIAVVASDGVVHVAGVWIRGGQRAALLACYAALTGLAIYLYRTHRSLLIVTKALTYAAAGALILPALTLLSFEITSPRTAHGVSAGEPDPAFAPRPDPLRDIYYLVCERYADAETLRSRYGYDDDEFYGYLTAKGFFVARNSRSNYLKTGLSLASSLNLTLLDSLGGPAGFDSSDWTPIYSMVGDHGLGRILRARGYAYIHVGGSWWPTRRNASATRNINYYAVVPRPLMQLLDAELLRPFQKRLATPWLDERRQKWDRTSRELSDLRVIAREPGPKFVFVHLFIPHEPYVFHRDGSFLPREEAEARRESDLYVDEIAVANAAIRSVIDRVLADSATPPIVVLQSDEGHYPRGTRASTFDWDQASPAQLREKSGILNAYFLPGAPRAVVYDSMTPVNSFRMLLNTYFGTHLALLPDRTFAHGSDRHPYRFRDVTEAVRQTDGRHAGSPARGGG